MIKQRSAVLQRAEMTKERRGATPISDCLLPNDKISNHGNLEGTRLPAEKIEKLLARSLSSLLPEAAEPDAIFDAITKVVAAPERVNDSETAGSRD
jgi:hypothetical protein